MASRQATTLPVFQKTVGPEYDSATGLGNWDSTRVPIDRVILHTMVGTAASADTRFNDSHSNVSSHYGVLESGQIWQWVDEDNTAYHCGNYVMNQRSIGIEHEDNGDYNGVRPDSLYEASARLVAEICNYYQIPIDRNHILKHNEVYPTGCPDGLDADRIVADAQKIAGNIVNGQVTDDPLVCDPKSVRDGLVTKATNFDDVCDGLQVLNLTVDNTFAPGAGKQLADRIKLLINNIQAQQSTIKLDNIAPVTASPSSTPEQIVPSEPKSLESVPGQANLMPQTQAQNWVLQLISWLSLVFWTGGKQKGGQGAS